MLTGMKRNGSNLLHRYFSKSSTESGAGEADSNSEEKSESDSESESESASEEKSWAKSSKDSAMKVQMGTGWMPVIGNVLAYARGPLEYLVRQKEKRGKIFKLDMGGRQLVIINDLEALPSLQQHVDKVDFIKFTRPIMRNMFGMGNAMIDLCHNFAAVEACGHRHGLMKSSTVADVVGRLVGPDGMLKRALEQDVLPHVGGEEWVSRDSLQHTMMTITWFSLTRSVFSPELCTEKTFKAFDAWDSKMALVAANVPFGTRAALKGRRLLGQVFGDVDALRDEGTSVAIQDEAEYVFESMSSYLGDEAVAKETFQKLGNGAMLALLWASTANTGPIVFWTILFLERSPDAVAAIRAEVDAFGSFDDLAKAVLEGASPDPLANVGSALHEALRLRGGSPIMRPAGADFELSWTNRGAPEGHKNGPFQIRKGEGVCVLPMLASLDPNVFEDPLLFKHDRFMGDEAPATNEFGARTNIGQVFFGHGAHKCPGRVIADRVLKLVIAAFVSGYDVKIDRKKGYDDPDMANLMLGVLRSKNKVPFQIRKAKPRTQVRDAHHTLSAAVVPPAPVALV